MSRNFYLTVAVLVVFAFAAFIVMFQNLAAQKQGYEYLASPANQFYPLQADSSSTGGQAAPGDSGAQVVTISYTDSGFVPDTVQINAGDTVIFKNQSASPFWPASNPHPIHSAYPTQGGCRTSTFDACKPIPTGDTWSFTFNIPGSWGFHNHLNPSDEGTVIVK